MLGGRTQVLCPVWAVPQPVLFRPRLPDDGHMETLAGAFGLTLSFWT